MCFVHHYPIGKRGGGHEKVLGRVSSHFQAVANKRAARRASRCPRACGALGIALGIFIWQFFAILLNSNGSTLGFPAPIDTFNRVGEYLFDGRSLYGHSIYEHILASLQRLLVAFALAAAFGIVAGSVLGYFTRLYPIGIVPVSIIR